MDPDDIKTDQGFSNKRRIMKIRTFIPITYIKEYVQKNCIASFDESLKKKKNSKKNAKNK